MKLKHSVFFMILVLQGLSSVFCGNNDFDFYYLVQQWPASYCDTKRSCCYPTTGKPAEDFSIHGLWPERNNGKWPQFCDETTFDESEVSDLIPRMQKDWPSIACPSSNGVKFWTHEWRKHGTCSLMNEHDYFQTALDLKEKANLLQVLKDGGIEPNGAFYSVESIKEVIKEGYGYSAFIECNVDTSRNQQLYQVYLCVDKSTLEFMDCPDRRGRCGSEIEFPSFSSAVAEI